jgi:hypothetical protein
LAGKGQVNCKCCNGEAKKNGKFKNVNRIVQRYLCLRCGTTFSDAQPLTGIRTEAGEVARAIGMLCEGIWRLLASIRRLLANIRRVLTDIWRLLASIWRRFANI